MAGQRKHFDVAPIDSYAPQHTSRPVIVGADTKLKKDPMVRDSEPESHSAAMLHHEAPQLAVPKITNVDDSSTESSSTPEVSSIEDNDVSSKQPEDIQTKPTQEDDTLVNQLIAQKTYQLPIRQTGSSNKLLVIIILIAIIVAISVYVALVLTDTL